jgi:hypothetical protein
MGVQAFFFQAFFFPRVRICYEHNPDIEFVTRTTGLSKHLVNQYISIIKENEKPNTKTA